MKYLLTLPVLFYSVFLYAEGLYDLSLKELNKVSIAGVHEEPISDTPAIVSVYYREDMQRLGLRSLREILSFIPGINARRGSIPNVNISIRGLHEDFNQKVLFLLDDVPYWISNNSDLPFLGIPSEAIERIEVIRGPGAVLYGSNASAGVIKIVTRKDKRNQIALLLDEQQTRNLSAIGNWQLNEHKFILAFETQRQDGYESELSDFDGENLVIGKHQRQEEVDSILLTYRHQGLEIMGHWFNSIVTGMNRVTPLEQPMIIEYQAYLLHLQYTWNDENYTAKLYSDYNRFYHTWTTFNDFSGTDTLSTGDDNGKQDYRFRLGSTLNYIFTPQLSLLLGLEAEERSASEAKVYDLHTGEYLESVMPEAKLNEYSVWAQLDKKWQAWRFVIGARLTDNELYGKKTTPRAAVVYSFDKSQALKLLYSTGFNSPNFRQTTLDIPPIIVGNPDLQPERVESWDLAYTFSDHHHLFTANVFYMQAKNFIEREAGTFINTDTLDVTGMEVDYQYKIETMAIMANAAWIVKKDDVEHRDEFNLKVPDYTLSLGQYYIWGSQQVGYAINHIGPMRFHTGDKRELSTYTTVNLNYQWQWPQWQWFVSAVNVLDEQVVYPDLGIASQSHQVSVQGEDGRFLQTGVKYQF